MGTSATPGHALGCIAAIVLIPLGLSALDGSAWADEPDPNADPGTSRGDRLSLADLAGYRAALSGKPTADEARPSDPPVPVRFHDLWEHPGRFRGRRVTVQGRVERIFRQGPVGSFPALVEAWIFSKAGDPFCLVFPLPAGAIPGGREQGPGPAVRVVGGRGPEAPTRRPAVPDPGRWVRFTGTFLKTIRYAGADGPRLAPLIVGDRTPQSAPVAAEGGPSATGQTLGQNRGAGFVRSAGSASGWILGLALALLAAGMIARQHLRGVGGSDHSAIRKRILEGTGPDLPLQFIDSPEERPG
jgi:hypothetical protein